MAMPPTGGQTAMSTRPAAPERAPATRQEPSVEDVELVGRSIANYDR